MNLSSSHDLLELCSLFWSRFKGRKEGLVAENSCYYILKQLPDSSFEAHPVDSFYNFAPMIQYRTLNAEEAEEEFGRYIVKDWFKNKASFSVCLSVHHWLSVCLSLATVETLCNSNIYYIVLPLIFCLLIFLSSFVLYFSTCILQLVWKWFSVWNIFISWLVLWIF